MGQEVEADQLGDEFKGYVFKITGGNDKDGFPMRQGVMVKVNILNSFKLFHFFFDITITNYFWFPIWPKNLKFSNINKKGRVRLLLDKNQKCYRPRRTGERRRKSIRGCIVGNDIAVLALAIAKKGEKEI